MTDTDAQTGFSATRLSEIRSVQAAQHTLCTVQFNLLSMLNEFKQGIFVCLSSLCFGPPWGSQNLVRIFHGNIYGTGQGNSSVSWPLWRCWTQEKRLTNSVHCCVLWPKVLSHVTGSCSEWTSFWPKNFDGQMYSKCTRRKQLGPPDEINLHLELHQIQMTRVKNSIVSQSPVLLWFVW